MVREASDLLAVCAWRGVIKGYIICAATTTAELPGSRAGSMALALRAPSSRPGHPRPLPSSVGSLACVFLRRHLSGRPPASEGPPRRTRVQTDTAPVPARRPRMAQDGRSAGGAGFGG